MTLLYYGLKKQLAVTFVIANYVPSTMQTAYMHYLISTSEKSYDLLGKIIITILHMRKLRLSLRTAEEEVAVDLDLNLTVIY